MKQYIFGVLAMLASILLMKPCATFATYCSKIDESSWPDSDFNSLAFWRLSIHVLICRKLALSSCTKTSGIILLDSQSSIRWRGVDVYVGRGYSLGISSVFFDPQYRAGSTLTVSDHPDRSL